MLQKVRVVGILGGNIYSSYYFSCHFYDDSYYALVNQRQCILLSNFSYIGIALAIGILLTGILQKNQTSW